MPAREEAVPEAAQAASPITRLPDPLLRLILRHLASAWPAGRKPDHYYVHVAGPYYELGWITLTQTCRRLRSVALDPESAPIWASNICALPRALPVILERARDAPLSVDLGPDDWALWESQQQALLDLINQHASRIGRVSIVLPSFSVDDRFGLRTALNDLPERAESCTRFHAALLDALADRDLPLLSHLDLSYTPYASAGSSPLTATIPFTAPNLTSLRLSRQRISADHLYDILRSSPLLTSISIEWIPSESPTLISLPLKNAGAPLHMPNLADLSLSAHDFASVLAVWKVLMPHKDVRASFNAQTSDTRDFMSALTALSPLFYRQGLHNLSLSTTTDTFTFRMLPKRAVAHSSSLSVSASPAPESTTTPSDLLDTLLRFIDSTWLDSLHLDVHSLSSPALSILSSFDTIVEMSCPFSSRSILAKLATESENDDPVFPSMGTLTLTESNGEEDSGGKEGEKWDVVQAFLKGRVKQGVEVDCVRLTGRTGHRRADVDEGMDVVRRLVNEIIDERVG